VRNLVNIASVDVIFAAIILTAILGYLLFWPVTPLYNLQQPIQVETRIVHPGGQLVYSPYSCRSVIVAGTVQRIFENSIQYPLTPTSLTPHLGCGQYRFALTVPLEMPPGIYRLHIVVNSDVNPLRTVSQSFYTEYFAVEQPAAK
jgi:hypothetical protein